jgi:uncharacterized protein (TIGR03086 family)
MTFAPILTAVAEVVRGTEDDQRDDPTPCAGWDVRALAAHVCQVVTAVELAGRGGPIPAELWSREPAGADFDAAARAWDEPPAGPIDMGGQQMPAEVVAAMLAADLVLHGWDLARATGQDWEVPAAAAEQAGQFLAGFAAQGREMGLFAEPVPVVAHATALDRALGLSGRDPAWRADTV